SLFDLYLFFFFFFFCCVFCASAARPLSRATPNAICGSDWWWQDVQPDTLTNSGPLFCSNAMDFSTDCFTSSASEAPDFLQRATMGVGPRRMAHTRAVSPILFL